MATGEGRFQEAGKEIVDDLAKHTRVPGGHAAVRDVTTKTLEDHMHSFFLAETCKYLYLLFDDRFMRGRNVVFSTEGHPLPVFAWKNPRSGEAGESEEVRAKKEEERRQRRAMEASRRKMSDAGISELVSSMKREGFDADDIVVGLYSS
jgi:mannosidase alpha-like ER degradation enhancer 1